LGKHDVLNDCTMTVDGTDFRIQQQGERIKGNPFGSHKYKGKSALRYELGVDILAGNLVWIQGPYPAGKYTDIEIFNKVLRHFLEPGERVEADEGYRGHEDKIKCPSNPANPPENLVMQGRVRARHETLNGRLKNWGILSQVFRHDISLHGPVFRACAVITQLAIKNGEPLFTVEYED
jgi:DDE superfamily endonuclease